jgi:hypothetical protein
VSCAPKHVEAKRGKAETRTGTDHVLKESRGAKDRRHASRVKHGSSDMDEVEIIEIPTSSVKTKRLETKRKANYAPKHAEDKRRKTETRNDTEVESRAGKDHGNALLVKGGSACAQSRSNTASTWPVGTRFRKEFPGHGTFQGTITSFDGEHYKVHYPSDGDSEELSDYELDDVEIIEIPTSKARASNKKIDR